MVPCFAFAEEIVTGTNEQALQSWQASVRGSNYTNHVTAPANTTTPNKDGTFYKIAVVTDFRQTNEIKGLVDFLQFGLINSNDRSVISQTPALINNLQAGRSTNDYFISGGDISPNFSSLSTNLGARGIIGQNLFGNFLVSAYTGVVAESWEALNSSILRSHFLRDIYGLKTEYTYSDSIQLYATTQVGSDRSGSVNDPALIATSNATNLQSSSVGFAFSEGNFKIAGEIATSSDQQETLANKSGLASILDAEWDNKTVALHLGYHDISDKFSTLSVKALPGVREAYLGADWVAQTWLTAGAEFRNGNDTVLATTTTSQSAKAQFSFESENPEWTLNLTQTDSKARDIRLLLIQNEQSAATLKYEAHQWKIGLTHSVGKVTDASAPTSDAKKLGWNLSVAKALGDVTPTPTSIWSGNVAISYSSDDHRYLTGTNVLTTKRSLSISAKHIEWGSLILSADDGATPRPNLPELTTESRQFDVAHDFTAKDNARIYWLSTKNNTQEIALATEEQILGAEYTHTF